MTELILTTLATFVTAFGVFSLGAFLALRKGLIRIQQTHAAPTTDLSTSQAIVNLGRNQPSTHKQFALYLGEEPVALDKAPLVYTANFDTTPGHLLIKTLKLDEPLLGTGRFIVEMKGSARPMTLITNDRKREQTLSLPKVSPETNTTFYPMIGHA